MYMRTAAEIKGNKDDFTHSVRCQLAHGECFVFSLEDVPDLVDEYRELLTPAEMAACFKRAQRPS